MNSEEIMCEVENLLRAYYREFPRGYSSKVGADYDRGQAQWAQICKTASPLNDEGEYIRIVEDSLRTEGYQL